MRKNEFDLILMTFRKIICLWVLPGVEEYRIILLSDNPQGSTNIRGQSTRRATAASFLGRRSQRSFFFAGTAEEAIALVGRLGWLARPRSPTQAADNIYGDTAIELLNEVVTWSVLVWFAR